MTANAIPTSSINLPGQQPILRFNMRNSSLSPVLVHQLNNNFVEVFSRDRKNLWIRAYRLAARASSPG